MGGLLRAVTLDVGGRSRQLLRQRLSDEVGREMRELPYMDTEAMYIIA